MRPITLLLAATLVGGIAGCLGSGGLAGSSDGVRIVAAAPADTSRGAGQYWMVWVHGNESRESGGEVACARAYDHDLDAAGRTLEYAAHRYPIQPADVRVVIAFDHYRPAGCVAAYGLEFDPRGAVTETLGGYGELTVAINADGSLAVEGREVPLGKAAEFRYSGRVDGDRATGSFRVENLGAWDQAGLRPAR